MSLTLWISRHDELAWVRERFVPFSCAGSNSFRSHRSKVIEKIHFWKFEAFLLCLTAGRWEKRWDKFSFGKGMTRLIFKFDRVFPREAESCSSAWNRDLYFTDRKLELPALIAAMGSRQDWKGVTGFSTTTSTRSNRVFQQFLSPKKFLI